jgi:integrase/recombinase XerD
MSEAIALKVGDVDGARMMLRIERGKGRKYRYALLPLLLLGRLRPWWRAARAEVKTQPNAPTVVPRLPLED